jgi:tRNA pseudouridine38-40 synthase
MMAQLVRLGRHQITLDDIKESLTGTNTEHLREIAPGSGLTLKKVTFE